MRRFHRRIIPIQLAIALTTLSPAMAQRAGQPEIACVRVDCSAFKRISDRFWIVTKGTIIPAGLKTYAKGQLGLPEGATIEPNLYQSEGFDLVDVLNRKCAKQIRDCDP